MSLPFTTDQFLAVFADYNRAVWPAQLLLLALGIALTVAAYLGLPGTQRLIALGLALLWAWMGVVYHLGFFRHINPAAGLFGAVFVVEAVLLVLWGLRRNDNAVGKVHGAGP